MYVSPDGGAVASWLNGHKTQVIIHFTFGLLVLNLCHSGSPVYKSWLERKNKFTVSKYESGINHYFPSHAEYRKSSSKDQMCEETNVNHVRLVSLSTIL